MEEQNLQSLNQANQNKLKSSQFLLAAAGAITGLSLMGLTAEAQNTPITGTGYNYSGIVEPTAGATLATEISNSVGTSTLDGQYTYMQKGLDSANPNNGFLVGTPFTSTANVNTTFTLLPDTASTHDIFVDQQNTGPTGGMLTLSTPTAYSSLALLVTGFDGAQTGRFTLNFADGTTQTGTFSAPDNYTTGLASQAVGANERVNVTGNAFANAGFNGGPFLFESDIAVTDTSALNSITFAGSIIPSNGGDAGYAVFAVSGHAVPEPSTYALLALGAASLVFVARRRVTA